MSNVTTDTSHTILDTFKTIYSTLNTVILCACVVIETLWFIMFLYRFIKNASGFVTPYFIIMQIGYFVNIVAGAIFIPTSFLDINFFLKMPQFLQIMYNIFYWYMWRFMGPWNTVLALNRFTGMFFYRKHERIWKGLNFKVILILLLLYPFALSSPYITLFIYCIPLGYYQENCINFYSANVSVSNLINGLISLCLGISTAMARKIRGQIWAKKQKFETYLLIQSIVSTIFLCCSEGSVILRLHIDFENQSAAIKIIFLIMENWMGQLFYCSSAIMIFCLSKTIRQSFISFYWLYFIPGIKNPSNNQVSTINNNSLTNS